MVGRHGHDQRLGGDGLAGEAGGQPLARGTRRQAAGHDADGGGVERPGRHAVGQGLGIAGAERETHGGVSLGEGTDLPHEPLARGRDRADGQLARQLAPERPHRVAPGGGRR